MDDGDVSVVCSLPDSPLRCGGTPTPCWCSTDAASAVRPQRGDSAPQTSSRPRRNPWISPPTNPEHHPRCTASPRDTPHLPPPLLHLPHHHHHHPHPHPPPAPPSSPPSRARACSRPSRDPPLGSEVSPSCRWHTPTLCRHARVLCTCTRTRAACPWWFSPSRWSTRAWAPWAPRQPHPAS